MVTVSVIVTVYNSETTIEKVISRIKNQSGVNIDFELEIIVIDDCSTDKSYSILKQMGVKLYKNKINSGGPNKGRNFGLKLAKGDFICFCDHDDLWNNDKIIKMLEFRNLAPIISSGYSVNDFLNSRTFNRVKNSSKSKYLKYEKNISFFSKLTKNNSGQNLYLGSLMIHKNLSKIKFEEDFGMVDYDWILKILHNNSSIEVCESLYTRKINEGNLSLDRDYRKNDFEITYNVIKSFSQLYQKKSAIGIKKLHGSYARYFYLVGDMFNARTHFLKSDFSLKNILYFITTFAGSKIVKKYFNVFG